MLRAKLGDSLFLLCQVTDEADSGPLFHGIIADCRFNHGLKLLSFLSLRLVHEGDVGKDRTGGGEDQRSGKSGEHLKPILCFRMSVRKPAFRAAPGVLGDSCRTFFAIYESHSSMPWYLILVRGFWLK